METFSEQLSITIGGLHLIITEFTKIQINLLKALEDGKSYTRLDLMTKLKSARSTTYDNLMVLNARGLVIVDQVFDSKQNITDRGRPSLLFRLATPDEAKAFVPDPRTEA